MKELIERLRVVQRQDGSVSDRHQWQLVCEALVVLLERESFNRDSEMAASPSFTVGTPEWPTSRDETVYSVDMDRPVKQFEEDGA